MRLTGLHLFYVAITSSTALQNGHLWTIDQFVESSSSSSIDADTAGAILARRRGLTSSRYLGHFDELTLQEIGHYGGSQQPLFSDLPPNAPGKLFIRVSGYDGDFKGLGDAMPDLWIEEPTKDLKTDFKAQSRTQDGVCEYAVPPSKNHPNSQGVEVIFSYPAEAEIGCLSASEIPTIPVILSLYSVLPASASSVPQTIGALKRVLRHMSATQNIESTILLLPSNLSPSKSGHHKEVRRRGETPLDLATPPTLSPELHTLTASNYSSNHTLPNNVPACFSSKDACTNTTNSCMGHGECYKAHSNCFKCKCSSTVVRVNDDGSKKTVQWGGNACEKKDVSVPFILFASFGIVFAALIAGSIGMLFGMGSEKLPSVLSAGVSGPTARK